MSIPKYDEVMLPFLQLLGDGETYSTRDIVNNLSSVLNLSQEELEQRLPSGQSTVFDNRVGWARTYLKKSGLIEPEKRGCYRITDRGRQVLQSPPAIIDSQFLMQFPEFVEFAAPRKEADTPETKAEESESRTPTETVEQAYQQIREGLVDELLQALRNSTPTFFEKVVLDVLVAMGYGGSLHDAATALGKSGDEGIDGVIKEDRLGLDVVYLQAKRWENPVGRPQVQAFAGSLMGRQARKGVFITTSQFTKEAKEYVKRIEARIVLIGGAELAGYMIDYGVGVSDLATYRIRGLDADYFD